MAKIQIEGISTLQKKLGAITAYRTIRGALVASALHYKSTVAVYPPSGPGNRPKGYEPGRWNTWYQRGYGTKWRRADGSVGARPSSETLGRRWTIRYRAKEAIIGNGASYGIFVQGSRQRAFHKANGWITVDRAAEQEANTILGFFRKAVERAMAAGV